MLATNFRHWLVEELLQEAMVLIDRCREDFDEYCSLHYEWNRFRNDLETQELQLDIAKENQEETAIEPQQPEAVPAVEAIEPLAFAREEEEGEPPEPEEEPPVIAEGPPVRKTDLDVLAESVQRKKELALPGGPFALDERRDLALKRLCRDYEEAVNRACVAEEGLNVFYDYMTPSSPLPTEAESLGASITNLTNWLRDAFEWITEYHQMEERFTRSVSVRSLVTRNLWVQVKQARESFALKLQLPEELFKEHHNCRLLGVAGSLLGEGGKLPWAMTVRLPERALYHRWGQTAEIDQSKRPSCLLGRVENRRVARPPEICGTTSWLNASPIGKRTQEGQWSLEIFKPDGAHAETFSHLEDVVLELLVAGIPAKDRK
jgi:hypothetical protein